MEARIQEHKFSLRSEYDIISGNATYTAQKALLALLAHLEVKSDTGKVVATIQSNFSLLHANYDFSFADGRNFHYACEKLWKGVYSCIGPSGNYHLFRHKGVRFSIFQDDTQIAAITRNKFVIGSGHEYDTRMNSNADFLVIACMILALNTEEDSGDDNNSFTYDFGSIGPEDRKFDESWQPGDRA